jgi:hypothetical protein
MAGDPRKAVDERFYLSSAKGGGMLRREIWVDRHGRVVRYNLAYINHRIYVGDNGRVLGYDSAHGFGSFEEIEMRFQREWNRLAKEVGNAQD